MRAALYGQEGAEARRALRVELMRRQLAWLMAVTLGRCMVSTRKPSHAMVSIDGVGHDRYARQVGGAAVDLS